MFGGFHTSPAGHGDPPPSGAFYYYDDCNDHKDKYSSAYCTTNDGRISAFRTWASLSAAAIAVAIAIGRGGRCHLKSGGMYVQWQTRLRLYGVVLKE